MSEADDEVRSSTVMPGWVRVVPSPIRSALYDGGVTLMRYFSQSEKYSYLGLTVQNTFIMLLGAAVARYSALSFLEIATLPFLFGILELIGGGIVDRYHRVREVVGR